MISLRPRRRQKAMREFADWFNELLTRTFMDASSVAVGSPGPTPRDVTATDKEPAE